MFYLIFCDSKRANKFIIIVTHNNTFALKITNKPSSFFFKL